MKQLLYNGEVELVFDEEKHRYFVNGRQVKGVTSILKVIAKPALVPWAVKCTVDALREEWKPGEAYDEIEIEEMLKESKFAYRRVSGKACTIGDLVHTWIEHEIKGEKNKSYVNPEVKNAITQFKNWKDGHDIEFLASEKKVYSRKYDYAGTFDGLFKVNKASDLKKGVYLFDIKTSKAIYPEYWLQLAAYRQALLEEDKKLKLVGHALVRCGKDGQFEIQTSEDNQALKIDQEGFMGALKLSEWENAQGKK